MSKSSSKVVKFYWFVLYRLSSALLLISTTYILLLFIVCINVPYNNYMKIYWFTSGKILKCRGSIHYTLYFKLCRQMHIFGSVNRIENNKKLAQLKYTIVNGSLLLRAHSHVFDISFGSHFFCSHFPSILRAIDAREKENFLPFVIKKKSCELKKIPNHFIVISYFITKLYPFIWIECVSCYSRIITMRVINERNFTLCHALWFVLLYIVCFQVASTNSRTSTLWKLNTKTGKITSYPKVTEVSGQQ